MKQIIKISMGILTVFLIVGLIILHFGAPYLIIKPHRVSSNQLAYLFPNRLLPTDFGYSYESVSILTDDSLKLNAYYIPSVQDSTIATIIYLHGIGGCKESYIGLACNLAEKGYSSLVFDGRGHGQSEGNYCTYGYYEKEDVSNIIDFLEKEKKVQKIGVWGSSLGGAIALQVLEKDQRLKFGIIESTFHDLRTIIFDYKKRLIGIGSRWMTDKTLERAAKIANFEIEKIDPKESAKHIHQPVFYAHGAEDVHISAEYGKEIFRNLASEKKELAIIEGANHHNLGEVGGENYYKSVMRFLSDLENN